MAYKYNEKILSVKDLKVSFKTDEGIVHAVRGVSFDLNKGETLCIVGESGSGKSVTSKTIMGILPVSAIIEGGEVMYEGEDLTKVSEAEFHRIRGHKIGMIFQDPLSSLNPIMKVGKQITEAMLVNKNHLKTRFEDLISKELTAYRNLQVKRDEVIALAEHSLDSISEHYGEMITALREEVSNAEAALLKMDRNDPKFKQAAQDYEKLYRSNKAKIYRLQDEEKAKLKDQKKAVKKATKEAKAKYKAEKGPYLKALKEAKKRAKKDNAQYKKTEKAKDKETIAAFDKETRLALSAVEKELVALRAKLSSSASKVIAQKDISAKEAEYNALKESKKKEREELIAKLDSKYRITRKEAKEKALQVMKEVGIPQPEVRFKQYPFEFSGGMRQRIVIAIALTANPDILICDEPTTALDVTIQAQILELINRLKEERHMSIIFITHDLGVVANMADRVAVMYAGKIVEVGTANEIFYTPKHPYTWALLSSIPDLDSKEKLEAIPGTPPYLLHPPVGDAFASRNKYALAIDYKEQPPYFKLSDTHYAASWLLDSRAPKTEPPKIVTQRIKISLERAGIHNEEDIPE